MAEKSWSLGRALRGMFVKPTIDETTWEDLEAALITADFGPDISERVVDELRAKVERYRTTDPKDLQRMLRETLEEHFAKFDTTLKLTERPAVVLVVGVNGVGKTTLLKSLMGLVPIKSGAIKLGGEVIASLPYERQGDEQLAVMREKIRDLRIIHLPTASHMTWILEPAVCARHILEFISAHDGSPRAT